MTTRTVSAIRPGVGQGPRYRIGRHRGATVVSGSAPQPVPPERLRRHAAGVTPVDARATVQIGPLRTVANYITAVRTVAAVAVAVAALVTGSVALLAVAYGVYWL